MPKLLAIAVLVDVVSALGIAGFIIFAVSVVSKHNYEFDMRDQGAHMAIGCALAALVTAFGDWYAGPVIVAVVMGGREIIQAVTGQSGGLKDSLIDWSCALWGAGLGTLNMVVYREYLM